MISSKEYRGYPPWMNKINDRPIFDVFQPGLKRGAASLPFAPHKKYFYVEHPTEGWRVYLRACCFLHEAGVPFQKNVGVFLVSLGVGWGVRGLSVVSLVRGVVGKSTRRFLLASMAFRLHHLAPGSISVYSSLCTTPATATRLL